MSLLESILETIFGRVHFMILVGNKPAIEVKLHDREIIIDVKNPVLAIELGLEEFFGDVKNKSRGSLRKKLKSMGYTIKVKYKIFELDL
ncbi:MAG: hypothetical protein KAU24_01755 [Candidatus Aenigmarchaeota archaeon]|nr:hypothetical protein [Candidatus Aenigmarchaeota archaeon]